MKFVKSFSSITEGYSTEERKDMASKGLALPDGSFPIKDLKDLKNAIKAYGRAKDQAKAAKFIAKRAKALGAEDLIPDTDDFQASLNESVAGQENLSDEVNEMAYGQLERIMDYAKMIRGRMERGQTLESWMFSKVTVAYENLVAVHDVLDTRDGVVESKENVISEGLFNTYTQVLPHDFEKIENNFKKLNKDNLTVYDKGEGVTYGFRKGENEALWKYFHDDFRFNHSETERNVLGLINFFNQVKRNHPWSK